jgi:GTP-binding protein HflX
LPARRRADREHHSPQASPVERKQYQRQFIRQREQVLLVQVVLDGCESFLPQEMTSLVESAGGEVAEVVRQNRKAPDRSFFVGRGKVEEISARASEGGIETLVFDHNLSPGQVSRLEDVTGCKVIDRTELILAIFAAQARTREARLQIELAQLKYALPRLSGMWHHFSRLGAGIGTRGPGETQLEIDRRRARTRIGYLEKQLDTMESQLAVRTARRSSMFTVTLVGYTNAGKSTLLNALCDAGARTEDRLFATLDTTSRRLELPAGGTVLISDTVGFIERLPETLVASFRTTLSVVRDSDLLLMVVDRADPYREQKMASVRETLDRIGAGDIPVLVVWNKCDLETGPPPSSGVEVSALDGRGLDLLLRGIGDMRDESLEWFRLTLDDPREDTVSWVCRNCLVRDLTRTDGSVEILGASATGTGSIVRYLENSGTSFRLGNWAPSEDSVIIRRNGEKPDGQG